MKSVFEDVMWYCLGKKKANHSSKHGIPKEYINITKLQNLMSSKILYEDDFYMNIWNDIMSKERENYIDKRRNTYENRTY